MNMIVAAQCHGASSTAIPTGTAQVFPSQLPCQSPLIPDRRKNRIDSYRFALFVETTSLSYFLRQLTGWVSSGRIESGSIAEKERREAIMLESEGSELATSCETFVDI